MARAQVPPKATAESNLMSKRPKSPKKGKTRKEDDQALRTKGKDANDAGRLRRTSGHGLSREDVLALGGDDDDLELLNGIDSEADGELGKEGNVDVSKRMNCLAVLLILKGSHAFSSHPCPKN